MTGPAACPTLRITPGKALEVSMRAIVRFALGIALLVPAAAQADKFAGAFLDGGAGARSVGMGNAFTAVANDASAIYWNPAGLAATTHHEVDLSHEFRFGNLIDYSFIGGIYQVRQRNGRFGIGVIRLGVDNIAFPDSSLWVDANQNGEIDPGEFHYDQDLDRDKIRFVNDAEYGVFVSYAQPAAGWLWGGSLKIIRQSVDTYSSFGLGLDFGVAKHDLLSNLDFGLAVHDLTGTYLSWSTGRKETIVPVPRLGLAYRWNSDALRGLLLLSGDAELHFDNRQTADQLWAGALSTNLHWGLEFTMQERLALRLGLSESQFQAGAGLAVGPMQFDYGIVPEAHQFDLSQRLSVRYVHGR
jgi:Uncharacterised protein family (UPF0164)